MKHLRKLFSVVLHMLSVPLYVVIILLLLIVVLAAMMAGTLTYFAEIYGEDV